MSGSAINSTIQLKKMPFGDRHGKSLIAFVVFELLKKKNTGHNRVKYHEITNFGQGSVAAPLTFQDYKKKILCQVYKTFGTEEVNFGSQFSSFTKHTFYFYKQNFLFYSANHLNNYSGRGCTSRIPRREL